MRVSWKCLWVTCLKQTLVVDGGWRVRLGLDETPPLLVPHPLPQGPSLCPGCSSWHGNSVWPLTSGKLCSLSLWQVRWVSTYVASFTGWFVSKITLGRQLGPRGGTTRVPRLGLITRLVHCINNLLTWFKLLISSRWGMWWGLIEVSCRTSSLGRTDLIRSPIGILLIAQNTVNGSKESAVYVQKQENNDT